MFEKPESEESKILDATAPLPPEVSEVNGIYDEDTGECIGVLSDEVSSEKLLATQELSFLIDGYWYVFKRDGKYKDE